MIIKAPSALKFFASGRNLFITKSNSERYIPVDPFATSTNVKINQ